MTLLLAIDVGNTNISLGLFRARHLVSTERISTQGAKEIPRAVRRLLRKQRLHRMVIGGVILSSVVPSATRPLKRSLQRLVGFEPLVVGETVQAPIRNRYRIPSQVGQDRLVNAVAAYTLYGGPVIVVDFGTAVTIDLVSGRREYRGGLIVPGIRIALEALHTRAALLPKISLRVPKQFLGLDTQGSMRSGIFFGYSALCDGIVKRLKVQYAPRAKVVGTGGDAEQLARYCRTIRRINLDLTLQGLEITYREGKRRFP